LAFYFHILKNCIHEAVKEAGGEKRITKEGKQFFWDAEIENGR